MHLQRIWLKNPFVRGSFDSEKKIFGRPSATILQFADISDPGTRVDGTLIDETIADYLSLPWSEKVSCSIPKERP